MNGVIEKTRKKREVSIAEAAAAIGIPRMLIDIRHGKKLQSVLQLARILYLGDFCISCCVGLLLKAGYGC